VHQNTVEQLIIFIPSLWIFANYINAEVGAGIGLLFLIGRQIYRGAYIEDPSKRTVGFTIGALSMLILLIVGVGGAVGHLL
jgi:glutathione S-transferase